MFGLKIAGHSMRNGPSVKNLSVYANSGLQRRGGDPPSLFMNILCDLKSRLRAEVYVPKQNMKGENAKWVFKLLFRSRFVCR